MLSLIDKGVEQNVDLNIQTVWLGSSAIVQMVFVTYLLTKVAWYAPFVLYIFLLICLCVTILLTKHGHIWRRKRDDTSDESTRHAVKILMSKFEVLLNDKIDLENKKYSALVDQISYYDSKKMFYEHRGFNTPTIMIAIITISLFLFLGYKFFYQNDITYAEVVLYL